ncbi:MAG: MFS transporter [Kineosporiaceae bacterium]
MSAPEPGGAVEASPPDQAELAVVVAESPRRGGARLVPAGVRELLEPLAERPVLLLWGSQLVSELGDWAARIAVTALVYERTASPTLAAAAFVAGLLPWLGPGQLLAALADRYGRRGVMIAADVVRAAIFVIIALVSMPSGVVLGLVALAGLATAPFEAARSAGLVEYTSASRVESAIRLSATTYDAGTLIGYAAGGVLLAVASPASACLLNAVTFAVSALLLLGLPRQGVTPPATEASSGSESAVRAVLAAGGALWRDPTLRAAAWLGVIPIAGGTALGAQSVTWADAALPSRPWVPGVVLAASTGVCLVLTVMVRPRSQADATLRLAGRLAIATGAAGALLCLLDRPLAVGAALVVTGAFFVPIVLAQTVIAPRLDPGRRAASFGLLMGLLTLAQAVVSPLVGRLVTAAGAPRAFAITCALTAAAALVVVLGPAVRSGRSGGVHVQLPDGA